MDQLESLRANIFNRKSDVFLHPITFPVHGQQRLSEMGTFSSDGLSNLHPLKVENDILLVKTGEGLMLTPHITWCTTIYELQCNARVFPHDSIVIFNYYD